MHLKSGREDKRIRFYISESSHFTHTRPLRKDFLKKENLIRFQTNEFKIFQKFWDLLRS